MRRTVRSRQRSSPSKGRLILFLAGGLMTAVLLVVVLISLEQRAPVQSAPSDILDQRTETGPSAGSATAEPPAGSALPPPEDSPSASAPKTLTFYDTLTERNEPASDFVDRTLKADSRSMPPAETPSDSGAAERKKQPIRFTIQVAAFSDRSTAEILTRRLSQKGYPVFILPHAVPERGTWYRVRVGHFMTREAAQDTAKRLSTRERLTTFIAREEGGK